MRWFILAVLAAGCSHNMSEREYCTRRETGWEMAFPNLTLTDAARGRTIDACVRNVELAPAAERERSLRCMNEHLTGHGHAYEQYTAFTRCEGVDPSREH